MLLHRRMNVIIHRSSVLRALFVGFLVLTSVSLTTAQQIPSDLFDSLQWRNIGPYRAGRTRGVTGVASQPNVFYIGVCNGGVWKTDDYGRTWTPIFDKEPTGSIGAVAVAPSDPNIVYVGSGEGLHRPDLSIGDGIYKSTDAGKTWTHLGLRDGQQMRQRTPQPVQLPDHQDVAGTDKGQRLRQSWAVILGAGGMIFKYMPTIDSRRDERVALQVGSLAIRIG